MGERRRGLLNILVIYFNTALVSCALMRFEGGDPTVQDGLRMANARLPQIIGWTLLSAGVGAVLSAIESRLEFVGRVMVKLIGVAWTIATYFVVPILAAEGLGPVASVKRSAQLLRTTWGEGLVGNLALGTATGLIVMMIILACAGMFVMAAVSNSTFLMFSIIALLVVALTITFVVNSALHQVFLAGLYRYGTTGNVPNGFSEQTFADAFTAKK